MFWGLFKKRSSEEPVQLQALNAEVHTAAQRIDAYFDGLLYEGMPMEQARWVAQQRDAAHAALTRQALASVLDGWQRPGGIR